MRKLRICTVIVVAIAALLLASVPVMAKVVKTEFTGTWCRTEVESNGITTFLENGRILRRNGSAFFNVDTNDPRVAGEFYIYDVIFNIGPPVRVNCPVVKDARAGHVQANFILTPSDPSINGTWEGRFEFKYSIEDDCHYGKLTSNGHGTGDLEGLKIRISAEHEFYTITCAGAEANDWPYMEFNGYILTPASVDGE